MQTASKKTRKGIVQPHVFQRRVEGGVGGGEADGKQRDKERKSAASHIPKADLPSWSTPSCRWQHTCCPSLARSAHHPSSPAAASGCPGDDWNSRV